LDQVINELNTLSTLLSSAMDDDDIPDEFVDPITSGLMRDPGMNSIM
jgi:hypothetical protein